MNKRKLTVTIGLPVYNEEKNIVSLLKALLYQDTKDCTIQKIIVVSDGSIDQTEYLVRKIRNTKIQLFADGNRKGKPARINEIFEASASDIVVILDADIFIRSQYVIERLVKPFQQDNAVALTSGKSVFRPSQNRFQQIVTTGIIIWEDIKKSAPNAEMYLCEGQIRGFSKKLYKNITFPDASADDVYAYLYCKQLGFAFVFVSEAKIYYKLPSTFRDYMVQHTRFLQSQEIQIGNFDKNFVEKFYTIGIMHKLGIVIKHMVLNPFWTSLYLLLLTLPKITRNFSALGKSATWQIATSTK